MFRLKTNPRSICYWLRGLQWLIFCATAFFANVADVYAQASKSESAAASGTAAIKHVSISREELYKLLQAAPDPTDPSRVVVPFESAQRWLDSQVESVTMAVAIMIGGILFALLSALIIGYLAYHVRREFWSRAAASDSSDWRAFLMQLPLGAPEGSVRALVSLFVIIFGFVVLATQRRLGLSNSEALSGFVGAVIAFYFASRGNDQLQKAAAVATGAAANAVAASETAAGISSTVQQAAEQMHIATSRTSDLTNRLTTNVDALTRTVDRGATPGAPSVYKTDAVASISTVNSLQQRLQAAHGALSILQQTARALGNHPLGTNVFTDAKQTLDTIDRLLLGIQPLLTGKPTPESVEAALANVESALPGLENAGLPGVLADILSTLSAGRSVVTAASAALAGGPFGVVAGVIAAAVAAGAAKDKFANFKKAVLAAPYDPVLLPLQVTATIAQPVMQASTIARDHFSREDSKIARDVVQLALQKDGDSLRPAQELLESNEGIDVLNRATPPFASPEEFIEMIDELRGAAVFQALRDKLDGDVTLPEIPGQEQPQGVKLRDLATAANEFMNDPMTQPDMERLLYLAEGLATMPVSNEDMRAIVEASLSQAIVLAQEARYAKPVVVQEPVE